MRFVLALALLLAPVSAWAQSHPGPGLSSNGDGTNLNVTPTGGLQITLGAALGEACGITGNGCSVTGITSFTSSYNHATSGNPNESTFTCNDTIVGSVSGASVCRYDQLILLGSGSISNPGHAVSAKPLVFDQSTGTISYINVIQPTYQMVNAHTVSSVNLSSAYLQGVVTGGTITTLNSNLCAVPSPAGSIGTYNCLYQPAILPLTAGGSIGTIYFALNQESTAILRTSGPIRMDRAGSYPLDLGPIPQLGGYTAGRYYYGVHPGGTSGTVSSTLSNIWWAPIYISRATTFTKIGVNIATAQPSALVELAIYNVGSGQAVGTPIANTTTLDASVTGDLEGAISVTLNPGMYLLGVSSNNNSLAITAYKENSGPTIWGSSTSSSLDGIFTAGNYTSWPTNPSLNLFSTANGQLPKIWLRP